MTARAGWDPPERCPDCGGLLEVDVGNDTDLADGHRLPVTVGMLCLSCDWAKEVQV